MRATASKKRFAMAKTCRQAFLADWFQLALILPRSGGEQFHKSLFGMEIHTFGGQDNWLCLSYFDSN